MDENNQELEQLEEQETGGDDNSNIEPDNPDVSIESGEESEQPGAEPEKSEPIIPSDSELQEKKSGFQSRVSGVEPEQPELPAGEQPEEEKESLLAYLFDA